MCKRCNGIDKELANFQRLRSTIRDAFALALIAAVAKDLQSERDEIHTDVRKSGP